MCGICGFYSKKDETITNLIDMNKTLSHRGPDDHGEEIYNISTGYMVGFGHRRLAVMDLSVLGHQPMHSMDKRISVIFNGEIYNFKELKKELNDYIFRSECDTEVLIAAYLKWGISFVDKLNGMFAIALLDRDDNALYLVRDRIGKKPLYYCIDKGDLYFSSELKAIMENQFFIKEIDTKVIGRFLHKQYIAAPDTIFKNVYKLEQGTILKFIKGNVTKWKYWDVVCKYHDLVDINKEAVFDETKERLENILLRSVKRRLIADVPVGAFLSGGYDSSLICAMAQKVSGGTLRTYSIGFFDEKINEAVYASQIADYLGTKHTEQYISEEEMLRLVEDIPYYYDEPFADASQIPTMLVSMLAKKDITVVLSGDGGDEFFSGYNIYSKLQEAQRLDAKGAILYYLRKCPILKQKYKSEKLPLLWRMVSDERNKEIKTQTGVNTYIDLIHNILIEDGKCCYYPTESKYNVKEWDICRMLLDMETYLPEDILCKVDRASMKYSLECRCPILDVEVMEYSYKIPQKFKNENGDQKKILKSIAHEYIPKELLARPKTGFRVPLNTWLQGPLRKQLLDFIEGDFLRRQGIFNVTNTQSFIKNYLDVGDAGKDSGANYSKIIWPFFVFQQWYNLYG